MIFGSRTVVAHLIKGVTAATLLSWAYLYQSSEPAFAIGALVLAIVAMRGCPMCWLIGLIETITG
ncbi:MAG: hypothetical protein HY048_09080 [Acidobacteria bacterium]|nr:hypothetical protein [Acidobacteriota bacterium]